MGLCVCRNVVRNIMCSFGLHVTVLNQIIVKIYAHFVMFSQDSTSGVGRKRKKKTSGKTLNVRP